MGFFGLGYSSAIVALVGDNGAVIINVDNGAVAGKHFVSSAQGKEWERVKEFVASNKKARFYVVLDHSSQTYNQLAVPRAEGFFSRLFVIKKSANLVDRKGFSCTLAVSGFFEGGDARLNCISVESHIEDGLFWSLINLVMEKAPNSFRGVLLLPLQLLHVAQCLEDRDGAKHQWIVLIVYTKAGDLRQIVLREGKLFSSESTAILQSERDLPYIIAGKVYHGVQDTIREIAVSHGEVDNADFGLYMVVPGSVKSSLLSFDLKKENINVFTPYELGKVLKVKDCVSVSSEYCDTAVLCSIMRQREFKQVLHTEKVLAIEKVARFKKFAVVPTLASIALVASLYIYNTVGIFKSNIAADKLSMEATRLSMELVGIRNDQEFSRINEMYDVVDLYRSLSNVSTDPIDLLARLGKLAGDTFTLTGFWWNITDDFRVKVELGVHVKPGQNASIHKKLREILGDDQVKNFSAPLKQAGSFTVSFEYE
ncbi:hypothetical protein ANPL_03845 [Anaplasma platys]|uniref:Uncharacterized protein n=1 Tax=Anaplasma platys TaxID=949 RepID=A0A858PZ14_9RICK|nr:hypothetical protein [Anaplasma platys]QJC27819.1 hypothetical protein ANPL_03845 [Anaplasma platys]